MHWYMSLMGAPVHIDDICALIQKKPSSRAFEWLVFFSYGENLLEPSTKPLLPMVEVLVGFFLIILPNIVTLKISTTTPIVGVFLVVGGVCRNLIRM